MVSVGFVCVPECSFSHVFSTDRSLKTIMGGFLGVVAEVERSLVGPGSPRSCVSQTLVVPEGFCVHPGSASGLWAACCAAEATAHVNLQGLRGDWETHEDMGYVRTWSLQVILSESWAVSVGSSLMRRRQLSLTITAMTSPTLAR